MFEIENNIPRPAGGYSQLVKSLEIGQCFTIPLRNRNAIRSYFDMQGFKCTTKKISDTEARVWRIE